jgi:hypothetical protein
MFFTTSEDNIDSMNFISIYLLKQSETHYFNSIIKHFERKKALFRTNKDLYNKCENSEWHPEVSSTRYN